MPYAAFVAALRRLLCSRNGFDYLNCYTFRFIKQSYNLEDIRVMNYQRLKNLVILVTAVAYFAATFLGQQMKLRILCEKLMIISQRFFGIPPFRFYALADGIRRILS